MVVEDRGDLPVVRFQPDPDHPRAQNLQSVRSVALRVAEQVRGAVESGSLPLVIGGDCTIELGVLAGLLHHADGVGLVYMDGHVDLNTPETTPSGSLDGMGMAHIIGVDGALSELTRLGPTYPLLAAERVALFGYNPAETDEAERSVLVHRPFMTYPVDQVRGRGVRVAKEALAALGERVDRVAVHLDVDVIDHADFPATDVPQRTAGLSFDEAMACLGVYVASPKLAGLTIAELNPEIGKDTGFLATRLIAGVVGTLGVVL